MLVSMMANWNLLLQRNISVDENDIVYRLRKRAEIRRNISTRKSVQEGKPDRIADLLEEAANEIEELRNNYDSDNPEFP